MAGVIHWVLGVSLLSTAAAAPPAAQKTAAAPKKDPFLTGKPFSVEELLDAAGVIFEGRLRQAIESRGLSFSATPESLRRLRVGGLSQELVDRIARRFPPPAAPPPAPKPVLRAGPLGLECLPAECEVLVNGIWHGYTEGGAKSIHGLASGKVFLDLKRDGYEGQQLALVLEPDVAVARRVVLAPTVATREKLGAEVFARVVETLGGEAGLAGVGSLAAAGSAALSDRSGARTEWSLVLRFQLPAIAYWEVKRPGADWWVWRAGEQSKTGGSRKLRGSPAALDIEEHLQRLLAAHPAAVIGSIRKRGLRLLADEATPGPAGLTLRAEGASDAYTITVGPDLTPARIVHEPAPGVAGVEAHYSDYRAAGPGRFPMSITLQAPASPRAMEIRLAKLESGAKLRDKDFRR